MHSMTYRRLSNSAIGNASRIPRQAQLPQPNSAISANAPLPLFHPALLRELLLIELDLLRQKGYRHRSKVITGGSHGARNRHFAPRLSVANITTFATDLSR